MSLLLGLPRWLLPGVLSLFALALMVTALRLLPRGYRFLPVVSIYLGELLGAGVHVAAYYLWTGKPPEYPVQ